MAKYLARDRFRHVKRRRSPRILNNSPNLIIYVCFGDFIACLDKNLRCGQMHLLLDVSKELIDLYLNPGELFSQSLPPEAK